jgi:hypothetical protein
MTIRTDSYVDIRRPYLSSLPPGFAARALPKLVVLPFSSAGSRAMVRRFVLGWWHNRASYALASPRGQAIHRLGNYEYAIAAAQRVVAPG